MTQTMIIAAAQLNVTVGNIKENLEKHYSLIELAIQNKTQFILFPEMSVTGYCRKEARGYAFTEKDIRLNKLKELSIKGNIVIVVGAPISTKEHLFIGSFIIYPNGTTDIYTKQYLHKGEELFYNASKAYNPIIKIGEVQIALAICADIANEKHPCKAKENKATLYAPSIFYSENGIEEGHKQLSHYAKKHKLNILMSNYTGNVCGVMSGGQSAFWNAKGELIQKIEMGKSGVLFIEKNK